MTFPKAAALAAALAIALATDAAADAPRCIAVSFTPGDGLQIVVWLEDSAGNFQDTLFITQQTGSFGLGNRPGRWDFNSGPMWPYGRRINTFPVWAHRNGQHFPSVLFQELVDANENPIEDPSYCQNLTPGGPGYTSCGENDLSHDFDASSKEMHYCRPIAPTEPAWDTMTCASQPYTDKGTFSTDATYDTGYPPRIDVVPSSPDSASVAMYKALNPYDAVSQPTPIGGTAAKATWPVPSAYPDGNYVMFVEVAKEFDFNTTYNPTAYPSPPGIPYSNYGEPYRGQPSVVYQVPIAISSGVTTASTMTYAGYGDPTGTTGTLSPPDATISTDTPGMGGARLELVADGSNMYRVKVDVASSAAADLPGTPANLASTATTSSSLTMAFVAPGIGSAGERVAGYEVRIRANDAMTADNFEDSMMVSATVTPAVPGATQTFQLTGLLPLTDYWIGVRAFDGCHNTGPLAIATVTTPDRQSGAVDACFVATAAYGSRMANDVELLRHFRDSLLERTVLGELGVEAYYTFGPALAGIVGESDLLRATARAALAPIVRAVRRLKF